MFSRKVFDNHNNLTQLFSLHTIKVQLEFELVTCGRALIIVSASQIFFLVVGKFVCKLQWCNT